MKKLLFVISIIFALAACKKQPYLDADKSSLSMDVAGGTEVINVSANYPWSASSSESWVKLKYVEGENTLTVTVSRNNDTDSRQAVITIRSEELTKTVEVKQAQRDAIELETSGRVTVDAEPQQLEIKLKSNVGISVEVAEGSDWVSHVSTKSMDPHTVTLAIKENHERSMRRALVNFFDASGAVSQQIMIDQEGRLQIVQADFTGVSEFKVPLVVAPAGVALSGSVFWDAEEDAVKYDKSLSRSYDRESSGRVRLEMLNAESVTFSNVAGLTRIDLSEF